MLNLERLLELASEHREALSAKVKEFDIGPRHFPFNQRPALMGVINLSPGSWYRESVCLSVAAAVQRGRVLNAQGAHIIDIGAESTLAHTERVSAIAQKHALLPVIQELSRENIVISAETYDVEVASACLAAGARVINLTGTRGTEAIYRLAAAHEAAVIICFVQGDNVREAGGIEMDADPIPRLHEYFAREVDKAARCGVSRIFLDPGLGFYYANLQDSTQRIRRQMTIFLNSFRLRTLGFPVCHALPHAFEFFRDEVRSAEPFFAVLAALGRADLFRTHEVPRTLAVIEALQIL